MNTNQNNMQQRPNQPTNVRPNTQMNSKNPYTENWVRIKAIKDGIIYLPTREMVTGVKVYPRNIFILDQIQQDNILNALKNCYNTFNYEFWLIVADRPVDISVYMSQLELMRNQISDPIIGKIVAQDIEKAKLFVNNEVVDTEYYILFKEKNMEVLNQKVRDMINGFASCNLAASQTSDDDLRIILDNFLNGGVRTDFGTVVLK